MSEGSVSVFVDVGDGDASLEPLLERAVRATLADAAVTSGEVSLALFSDREIQELHRDHLGHDAPTDVLAFALWSGEEPVCGDVYVGYEQAKRQAAAAEVPLLEELIRLSVHGTLHIVGYDHPEEYEAREASEMYRMQEGIVSRLMELSSLE